MRNLQQDSSGLHLEIRRVCARSLDLCLHLPDPLGPGSLLLQLPSRLRQVLLQCTPPRHLLQPTTAENRTADRPPGRCLSVQAKTLGRVALESALLSSTVVGREIGQGLEEAGQWYYRPIWKEVEVRAGTSLTACRRCSVARRCAASCCAATRMCCTRAQPHHACVQTKRHTRNAASIPRSTVTPGHAQPQETQAKRPHVLPRSWQAPRAERAARAPPPPPPSSSASAPRPASSPPPPPASPSTLSPPPLPPLSPPPAPTTSAEPRLRQHNRKASRPSRRRGTRERGGGAGRAPR
eukprot:1172293-Rhodomonas_salina.1